MAVITINMSTLIPTAHRITYLHNALVVLHIVLNVSPDDI
jgi:hypothetical protein